MKAKYLAPNFFTISSLIIGLVAMNAVMDGNLSEAAWLVALSMVCDAFDGKIARFLNASSRFGAEMDSFADFFVFGVTPGFLAYKAGLENMGIAGGIICIIFILCGVSRLAKFNVYNDDLENKKNFQGLPIPAAAGMVSSFILINYHFFGKLTMLKPLTALMVLLSLLMVSKIEYSSGTVKDKTSLKAKLLKLFVLTIIISAIFYPVYVFFGINVLYTSSGIIKYLLTFKNQNKSKNNKNQLSTDEGKND
ncbi:MAG: CDP-diacylglycerol--serine O-phosphatidyltransferase [Candidatus Cloacimonadota bacterium]|nr:MAG: CDP-diacylglycerol--serine O-phosphatidyltransferase [Candidatus Cloacimonadota bacterium]